MLESIYEEALCYELDEIGLGDERQQAVLIRHKRLIATSPLRLDLVVENKVIVDNEAKAEIHPIDKQALLSYLSLKNPGLIINFNMPKLVDGVSRVVNKLEPPPSS